MPPQTNWITSDDILGKNVIDPDGNFIGVAEKILVDSLTIEIQGIAIDKGFLSRGLVIGKEYIERVTPHAIFLKEVSVVTFRGMQVFDSFGKLVGVVTSVTLIDGKNIIESLSVKTKKTTLTIPQSQINLIGKNVILNISLKDME